MSRQWCTTMLVLGGVSAAVLSSGCDSPQSRAQIEANTRWNRARAQVKAKLASDQFEAGNIEGAAGELSAAHRLDPNNTKLTPLHVRILLAGGKITEADALLEHTRAEQGPDAEIEYLIGVVRQQQQRWDEALEAYQQAVELDQTEVAYVVATAQAWLQLGEPHTALAFLAEKSPRFGWTNAYQAILAECYEQIGNWSAAASSWQRVVYGEGADTEIRARLAEALYRARRYTEAIHAFVELIEEREPDPPAWMRLTLAECYLAEGRNEASREQAQLALRSDPENTHGLRLLARCLAATGEYGSALRVARRALSIDAADPHTLELTAGLAWRCGDRQLALATADRLLGLEPGNAVAQSIVQRTRIPALEDGEQR